MRQNWRLVTARSMFLIAVVGGFGGMAHADSDSAAQLQLSPEASAQINSILAEKAQRTEVERRIDSNLLHAARAMTQRAAGNAVLPADYVQRFMDANVAGDGTVKVQIEGTITSSLLAELAALGASELNPVPEFGVVTARVPVLALQTIAGRPDVRFINNFDPGTSQLYLPTVAELAQLQAASNAFDSGNTQVYPANVIAHGADKVQSTGIRGAGVKVCVLSDGVNSLASEQSAGRLPAVDVVAGQAGNGNEGTAMLEIIYQIAPGATLGFATAQGGFAAMASNILTLRNAPHNCDIIVDDWTYFLESAFQDGTIDNSVNSVVASGGLYFSSAANSGSAVKGTSGTWEGDFVNSNTSIGILPESGQIHSFGATNYDSLTQQGSSRYQVLSWSDPMGASSNDYDLFVLDSTNSSVLAQSTNSQNGSQNPQEVISGVSLPAGSRFVVLNYLGTAAPRALRLDTERGRLSIGTNGNSFGHNAATSAITTAAVSVATANGGEFTGGPANPVETYSSDGPRKIFFAANGTAITPGNYLSSTNGGTTRNKVDLAATDCVVTGPVGGYTSPTFPATFCGTSAAAPHAGAIAALIKSAKPSLSMSDVLTALKNTTLDIEAAGYEVNAGVGLVMADSAVKSVLTPLTVGTSFFPSQIHQNQSSTLTITLTNPNSVALQNIAFTATYQAGLKNSASPSTSIVGAGCAGSLAASSGGGSLVLTGGTVPAGGSCSFTVLVTSSVMGTYVISTGAVMTPIGLNSGAGSASLAVTKSTSAKLVPIWLLLLL